MSLIHIALLPGDGIGPEVLEESVNVLKSLEANSDDLVFDFRNISVGAGEFLRSGNPLPPTALKAVKQCDAILLGAMGLPDVRWPNGTEMAPQIDIREQLDLYQGIRPIKLYMESLSPLKGYQPGSIDLVLYRENTEGLFWDRKIAHDTDADEVTNTMRISRHGTERIVRAAFEEAQRRKKHKICLVDKANVLPAMALFREVFDAIAEEYPNIETERVYVDAAALYLVQQPERFDVIVTENMFGDILSDLAAGIIGGMGMAPSADIGQDYAVFQPAHGSAPDIAGQNAANPLAMILSAAMMLDWLDLSAYGNSVRHAVEKTLQDPANRTRDIGGSMSCTEMGDAVIRNM